MKNAELIKALRICANQTCCDNCPRYDIDHTQDAQSCCIQLINDAADALEAAEQRISDESIPKWTSVADGLPKQDGFYEVCVKEQYTEARRFGRKLKVIRIYEYRPCGEGEQLWIGEDFANENLWVGEDGSYVQNSVVTHWRPCPELPENEKEEK